MRKELVIFGVAMISCASWSQTRSERYQALDAELSKEVFLKSVAGSSIDLEPVKMDTKRWCNIQMRSTVPWN